MIDDGCDGGVVLWCCGLRRMVQKGIDLGMPETGRDEDDEARGTDGRGTGDKTQKLSLARR